MELIEANKIQILSRVKFLGVGDKPNKLFFVLLKAKKLQESMHLLITDFEDTLKGDDNILQEVKKFALIFFRLQARIQQLNMHAHNCFDTLQCGLLLRKGKQLEVFQKEEEVRDAMKRMLANKLPRLDGMMLEVLKAY